MKYFHPKRLYNRYLSAIVDRVIPDFFIIQRYVNIVHPRTWDEKVNWLKIFDRKPLYHKMVDKCEVKPIIAEITKDISWGGVIPTIGVFNKFEEIDFNSLPNEFVIKCTHDSESIIICKDKKSFDISAAREKINRHLKIDYSRYWNVVEWVYRGVKPRIIIEPFMKDRSNDELVDYKFYCFNGEPKYIFYAFDRFSDVKANMYDLDWNLMPFNHIYQRKEINISRPPCIDEMAKIARRIAKYVNSPFLRVDFYFINGEIYFGEVTFYPNGGFGKFDPEEWNLKLGELIDLKKK